MRLVADEQKPTVVRCGFARFLGRIKLWSIGDATTQDTFEDHVFLGEVVAWIRLADVR